jgi:tetratricopeptide (TPR) repeat protein
MRISSLLCAFLVLHAAGAVGQEQPGPVAERPTTPQSQQAQERLTEGQRLMKQDKFRDAVKAFEEAVALNPLLVMAHYGLGSARMALKEYPAAITAFEGARRAFEERAVEIAKVRLETEKVQERRLQRLEEGIRNSPESTTARASREGGQRQQLIEAQRDLDRSREEGKRRNAPPPGLFLALGSAYFRVGRLADAEREYRAAIDVEPGRGEPRVNLAVVLLMTGKPVEAKEQIALAEKSGLKPPAGLKADIDAAIAKGR